MSHLRTFSDTVLVLLHTQVEVRAREGRAVNIHMFCGRRPGLLLSTMRAMDNLGLDIQQAVISCFNGFAMDIFRAEVEPLSVITSLASI